MDKATFLSKGVKPRKVPINSIDAEVYIRPMSYSAMVALGKCEDLEDRTLTTVLYCLVDENGNALFQPSEKEELGSAMPFDVIREIANAIIQATTSSENDLVK